MRLAIMQPYLFPYMGYFQLMAAVDRWVVYDDVQFIKGGWINRNSVRVGGRPHLFTVPLADASANKPICETGIDQAQFPRWRVRFQKTLQQSYRTAPFLAAVLGLVEETLGARCDTISELNVRTLAAVRDHVGLSTEIVPTSRQYGNEHLRGQERVLDICARERAATYVNAIGGQSLYSTRAFADRGVELWFLKGEGPVYEQGPGEFVPNLSILDAMMHVHPTALREMLGQAQRVRGSIS
jgi:hypothetical protein